MESKTEPAPKRKRRPFTPKEKAMVLKRFKSLSEAKPEASNNELLKVVATDLGIHWASVFNIVREKNKTGTFRPPKKDKPRVTIAEKTDSATKTGIRNIVQNFYSRHEIPTLDKIVEAVNTDGTLGTFKRSTMNKLLKNIGFQFSKRSKSCMLIDKDDVFFSRRNYLRAIRDARQSGKQIYYMDETLINQYHTANVAWMDTTVQNAEDAFMHDLKKPSGRQLIVTHIGSENGFVDEAPLLSMEPKKDDKNMKSNIFEEWFSRVLDKIEDNSIIVLDNAAHHSRRIENIPTKKTKKEDIVQWLREKNISFCEDMLKRELLKIVDDNRHRYDAYVVDEMAKSKNKTVLRLPPYHCDLNPIHLIWALVKDFVAQNNQNYIINEVKKLISEGVANIDSDAWKECIQHVVDVVEPSMDAMDMNVENMTESLNIKLEDDTDSSESDNC